MTIARRVIETLAAYGVRQIYGVPAGAWLPYLEAMQDCGIRFILAATETSAAFMAATAARLTGKAGVCYGTFGPGATNLATGVGCALLDRLPLLALTSEYPAAWHNRAAQMRIDHQALFAPLTKETTRLDPGRPEDTLYEALSVALSEVPGPVHVGLPSDLADGPAPPPAALSPLGPAVVPEPAPASALEAMLARFRAARRPLLAVGLSAVRHGLGPRVRHLMARHGLPCVLTPMAKGLVPHHHPGYGGVLFHSLGGLVAALARQADLILAIGYDPVEVRYAEWVAESPIIHLDTAPDHFDPPLVGLNVCGAIAPALDRLLAEPPASGGWDLQTLADHRAALFARLDPPPGAFTARHVLALLRAGLAPEGILVCDVGAHTHLIGQFWPTPAPDRLLMTNGWSAMGFGIPAALAAKVVAPDAPVVCVTGDGGFLMAAGDLLTARRHKLPILFIVLCDRQYSLIRAKQARLGLQRVGTTLYDGSLFTARRFLGIPVQTIRNAGQFQEALRAASDPTGPLIMEVCVSGDDYDGLLQGP